MINPSLIAVSALFFISASALLYFVAWAIATALMRGLHWLTPHRRKSLFFAALVLPPILAIGLTAGGTFFRHIHSPAAEHHNVLCGDVFRFLVSTEEEVPSTAGMLVSATAWLVLLGGGVALCRMLAATISLQRGLRPFLREPSPKLTQALARTRSPGQTRQAEFFEATIPPAYSCLLGFWRVRCILSQDLVASTSEEELDAVVTHELNHMRAGDVLSTFVVSTLNCVLFFLRPVRLLSRRWREETELACDAATVTMTGKPLALAAAILRAQGVAVQTPSLPAVALAFSEEAACASEKRVEQLLSYSKSPFLPTDSRNSSVWQWLVTGLLALLGTLAVLSPQTLCATHCGLEAIARALH